MVARRESRISRGGARGLCISLREIAWCERCSRLGMARVVAQSERQLGPYALPVAVALLCALLLVLLRPAPSGWASEGSSSSASTKGNTEITQAPSHFRKPSPKSGGDVDSSRIVPSKPPPIDLAPDTQRLAEEIVPGTTEWEEVPLVGEHSSLVIRFMPQRFNVIVPMPIVLLLQVVDKKTQTSVSIASVTSMKVRLRPLADEKAAWIDVPVAADGTATYVPHDPRELLGRVLAEGVVETPEAGVRRVPTTFIYTRGPGARLTGAWNDELREGHLFLHAEVEVDAPGLFTLMAQVVGPSREPIALTRKTVRLPVGKHGVTLRVFGKALHDKGVDGPYHIRNVLLTRDMNEKGDYDPGPTIIEAHVTRRYQAKQFSAEPYRSP